MSKTDAAAAKTDNVGLSVAIGGLGTIGRAVAAALDRGIAGMRLVAVSGRDTAKAEKFLSGLTARPKIVPLAQLGELADIVIECAPAAFMREIAEPALRHGRKVFIISVGALLDAPDLIELASQYGAQIIVPTGALIGLDAVTAAAEGTIRAVRMRTRKPVRGLLGAPYLTGKGIDIDGISEPVKVFEGTAREAALGFPANLNVGAALGLAGVGPDRTIIEIWADPGLERNTHQIEVDADSASFSMTIGNIPSAGNPRTGKITALSVIAALRKLTSPLRIGT
jgi:aspartate dehydrogenase